MSRNSEIKMAVLRGVYEDNLGMPRSCHGKRQSKSADGSARSGFGSVWKSKVVLLALLTLIGLLGINFRLVKVDPNGPAAMQLSDRREQELTRDPLQVLVPPPPELSGAESAATPAHYEAILSGLGMPVAELFNLGVQTIVIDPGHGGIDPGATGHNGLREKDVALDIARRLQDKLSVTGKYRILLTREDDRKVFLKERVAFAKQNHADLFISIHINSVPPEAGALNYVETFYFGAHTDQRSLALAEKENHDSDYVMGDFRRVIARLGDTLKIEESRELAGSIHRYLYESMKRADGDLIDAGFKTGPFVVLLGVEVPSVLVEVSCISSKAEEARLAMPEYRDSIADFLKTGIVEYLEERNYRKPIERGTTQHVARQEG